MCAKEQTYLKDLEIDQIPLYWSCNEAMYIMNWMDRIVMWKMESKIIYEINIFQIVLNVVVFEFERLLHSIKIGNYIVLFMILW